MRRRLLVGAGGLAVLAQATRRPTLARGEDDDSWVWDKTLRGRPVRILVRVRAAREARVAAELARRAEDAEAKAAAEAAVATRQRGGATAAAGPRVVVVGGGIMGASAALALARRGARVALLDAEHAIRGSWGETRAAHLAQSDPLFFDMAKLGFQLYDRVERATGRPVGRRGEEPRSG